MAGTYREAIAASFIPSGLTLAAAMTCAVILSLALTSLFVKNPKQPSLSKTSQLPLLFFLLIWILPIFYLGIARDTLPGYAKFRARHNISSLFIEHWDRWAIYYPQVKLQDRAEWISIPQEGYFDHGAFGDLNRFLLYMWFSVGNTKDDLERRHYMLRWFAKRYHALNPSKAPPREARLLWTSYKPELGRAPKREPWTRPELSSLSADSVFVLDSIPVEVQVTAKRGGGRK